MVIRNSTTDVIMALREKEANPATQNKAAEWLPKAESIQAAVYKTTEFINHLKQAVAGNNDSSKTLTDLPLPDTVISKLYCNLMDLHHSIMETDPRIKEVFDTSLIIINKQID